MSDANLQVAGRDVADYRQKSCQRCLRDVVLSLHDSIRYFLTQHGADVASASDPGFSLFVFHRPQGESSEGDEFRVLWRNRLKRSFPLVDSTTTTISLGNRILPAQPETLHRLSEGIGDDSTFHISPGTAKVLL